MPASGDSSVARQLVFSQAILLLIAIVAAMMVTRFEVGAVTLVLGGTILILLVFVYPEAALMLLAILMLLSPEFMVGDLSGAGTGGRGVTLRMDDIVIALLSIGWLTRRALLKDLPAFRFSLMNVPMILYASALAFATVAGILIGSVQLKFGFFFLLKYVEYFFVFAIVLNEIRSASQIKRLVVVLFVVATIVALYALAQVPLGQRASAPFEGERGEPNTLGGYLLLMIGLGVGLLPVLEHRWLRRFMVVFILISIYALGATLSRSSFLGLAGMYLFGFYIYRKKPVVLAGLLVLAFVGVVLMPQSVKDRIGYTFNQARRHDQVKVLGTAVDTSTSARLMSMAQVIEIWKKSPLFGFGVGGTAFIDAQYFRILHEAGAIGIAAFFFLLFRLFRLIQRARDHPDPFLSGLATGFLFGLVGLLLHSIGANTFIIVRIMEPFWMVAGCLAVGLLLTPDIPKQTAEELADIT